MLLNSIFGRKLLELEPERLKDRFTIDCGGKSVQPFEQLRPGTVAAFRNCHCDSLDGSFRALSLWIDTLPMPIRHGKLLSSGVFGPATENNGFFRMFFQRLCQMGGTWEEIQNTPCVLEEGKGIGKTVKHYK
jgi:hypothetical protein